MILKHRADTGAWPQLTQMEVLLDTDRRGVHKSMQPLRRRLAVASYRGRRYEITYRVTDVGFALLEEIDPAAYRTYAKLCASPSGKDKNAARRRAREALLATKAPVSDEIMRAELLDAIAEWKRITGDWPTRPEVLQMAEDYTLAVIMSQLRKLTKSGDVMSLLYVCPKSGRRETRYRSMRVASTLAA
jgi:hypothetical protein